jgi:hypothetical protein
VDTVFRNVGWYMFHDGKITFPVGGEDARSAGIQDPVFVGGLKVGDWDDMQIDVDAYSMERTSELLSQKRAVETFQVVTTAAQAMPSMPWVRWRDLMSFLGDAQNVPQLQDFIDESVLQQVQQAMSAPPSGKMAEGGVGGEAPAVSPTGEPQVVPARAQAAIAGAAARM